MSVLLLGMITLFVLVGLLVRKLSPPLYARTFGPLLARLLALKACLLAGYQQLHTRLLARYEASDGYLKFASKSLLVAVGVFLVLPPVLRIFYPSAGSFDNGTINVLGLAALQYFAAAHLALYTYRRLFPPLYAYLVDFSQDKVLESLTKDLQANLSHPELATSGVLPVLVEQRKLLQFKFYARCARFTFCLLPLLVLFAFAQFALTSALTVVPH